MKIKSDKNYDFYRHCSIHIFCFNVLYVSSVPRLSLARATAGTLGFSKCANDTGQKLAALIPKRYRTSRAIRCNVTATTTQRRDEMTHNRNKPAAPTSDGGQGLTKHESASLQILCSLLTVRGYSSDDDLTTHACQSADLCFDKLEQD